MGDKDPKQLVRWIGAFLRNQISGNIGRMSSESSHLTHAGVERPQLTRVPRVPT